MSKNITITSIDSVQTKEQIGEKEKKPLAHEKLFKEFNINPEKVFDGTILKQIPNDWVPEIIENNIKSCINVEIIEAQHVSSSHVFILIFDNYIEANKFDLHFSSNMFKIINKFIENKKEKPENYHRNIIFTKNIDDKKITIQY